MKIEHLNLYSFHKEIVCFYYKTINEVMTAGVVDRSDLTCKSHIVGFWKIKQLKQQ